MSQLSVHGPTAWPAIKHQLFFLLKVDSYQELKKKKRKKKRVGENGGNPTAAGGLQYGFWSRRI